MRPKRMCVTTGPSFKTHQQWATENLCSVFYINITTGYRWVVRLKFHHHDLIQLWWL